MDTAHVLWTGGWDSSFRVLDLVLVRHTTVQPWYIIDEKRASSGKEIDTMLALRARIAERDADAAARLLPTRYCEKNALPADPLIKSQFHRLTKQAKLGTQYKWLADFAVAECLDELELSVHREDKAHAFLEPNVRLADTSYGPTYRLQEPVDDPDVMLFKRFRFPLLDWTKPEMATYAAKHDFEDLMEHTWFCHAPKGGRPCGMCPPCGFTMAEGLKRRVPAPRRFKRHLRSVKRNLLD